MSSSSAAAARMDASAPAGSRAGSALRSMLLTQRVRQSSRTMSALASAGGMAAARLSGSSSVRQWVGRARRWAAMRRAMSSSSGSAVATKRTFWAARARRSANALLPERAPPSMRMSCLGNVRGLVGVGQGYRAARLWGYHIIRGGIGGICPQCEGRVATLIAVREERLVGGAGFLGGGYGGFFAPLEAKYAQLLYGGGV